MFQFLVLMTALVLSGTQGCSGGPADEAPRIQAGQDVCRECGMTIQDARFAAARRSDSGTALYDSIECLVRACRRNGCEITDAIWIADLDGDGLHPQSSMTIVAANYPSPMGGGLAAFRDPERARAEARTRSGESGSFSDALGGRLRERRSR